ncbi:MAG: hypothetical protein M3Q30_00800 [Actinomycetota bacterium]|nr:hypothetical protein [Actinomycetota bacterium]
MRWPERLVRRVDEFQQRNRPLGFLFAVVKKFGDDRAGMLAALMAYWFRALSLAAGTGVNVALSVIAFRILTPKHIELRDLAPGP